MGCRVHGIGKLRGDKGVGEGFRQLLSFRDGPFHALGAVGQHDFCAVGRQQFTALYAHRFRHGEDGPIASGRGRAGQADTRVAAGRFDDDGIFRQEAALFRVLDHRRGDAIFHTSRRIKIFQLH